MCLCYNGLLSGWNKLKPLPHHSCLGLASLPHSYLTLPKIAKNSKFFVGNFKQVFLIPWYIYNFFQLSNEVTSSNPKFTWIYFWDNFLIPIFAWNGNYLQRSSLHYSCNFLLMSTCISLLWKNFFDHPSTGLMTSFFKSMM